MRKMLYLHWTLLILSHIVMLMLAAHETLLPKETIETECYDRYRNEIKNVTCYDEVVIEPLVSKDTLWIIVLIDLIVWGISLFNVTFGDTMYEMGRGR